MKKILLTVAAIAFVLSMVACGGTAATTEVVEAAASTATGDEAAAMAAEINRRVLSPLVIHSFPYMSAKKGGIIDEARIVRRVIGEISLPVGYKISVIGHNDKNEKKSGVGLQRANAVYYELRALGVDPAKLKVKSATDTDMVSGEDAGNPAQRRVTFKCELAR